MQAMQAGFEKDSWRLHHHLGRAAIDIDSSWYDVLVPGLTSTSELSLRKQEVLQAQKKLVEAFWQALPINNLKYGNRFVAGLPHVEEVMQTNEYASFSDRVLHAECDNMEKLQMMQEVPYLAESQQANYARQGSQQVPSRWLLSKQKMMPSTTTRFCSRHCLHRMRDSLFTFFRRDLL